MNVQNLRDNYPKLISHMESNGYSKTYVARFKREIEKILTAVNSKEWSCYTDVYLEYTKTSHSPYALREKRTIIGAIEQFEVHGRYPNGRRRHELFERGSYPLLSPEFKSVIDLYCEVEKKRGKKSTAIYTESHNASTFFLSLQKKGINSLEKTTEDAVLSIFMSPDETQIRSCSYKKNIAAVLKACIPYHPETCPRILAFLPALRETRKNIQYLTSEEVQKIKETLADDGKLLTLRDRAIGMLVLYTGLRGCDIAGLTFDTIDWDKDFINIKRNYSASKKNGFVFIFCLTGFLCKKRFFEVCFKPSYLE